MARRRGSAASAAHAERMRALRKGLRAGPQLPLLPIGRECNDPAPSGRGRPAGARNWITEQFDKYMAARGYVHPALMWAEIMSRPVELLSTELQVPLARAFELQMRASENLAPYVGQKLPVAVQIDTRGDFTLQIEGLSSGAAMPIAGAEGLTIEGAALPIADDGKSKA